MGLDESHVQTRRLLHGRFEFLRKSKEVPPRYTVPIQRRTHHPHRSTLQGLLRWRRHFLRYDTCPYEIAEVALYGIHESMYT